MELEPLKHDSPSIEYLQMPKFVWEMEGLSLNAKNVYMLIYDRIRQGRKNENFTSKGGYLFCFYSDEELARQLKMSKETVKRTVSELKKAGLLKREKKSFTQVITTLFVPCQSVTSDHFESVTHDPSKVSPVTVSKVSPVTISHPYIYKEQISKNNEQENKEISSVPKPKKIAKSEQVTKAIIDHWNGSYGTKYSSTTKGTIKLVDALLKSGYSQDQILEVIDYRAKTRRSEADYKWFVPATVLALKNFDRSYQFMINDQVKPQAKTVYGSQPNRGYRKNGIPESTVLPEWYEVKEPERASESDVRKILELQNQTLKGERQ